MKLSVQSKKTLDQLKKKSKQGYGESVRMPSLKSIHLMLNELGVQNSFGDTTHVVEYRSGLSPLVNDRHDGASGHDLKVWSLDNKNRPVYSRYGAWHADSSESYYSWNTSRLASQLLQLLTVRKIIK